VESHNISITDTQNFPAYRRDCVRKSDSSVSTVTGLRVGGMVNRFVILDRAGYCVFYRLHANSGPRCDAFQKFLHLRIWFTDSHSNSVSMLRVGQPGF
jgi:hypothetical protein